MRRRPTRTRAGGWHDGAKGTNPPNEKDDDEDVASKTGMEINSKSRIRSNKGMNQNWLLK